MDVVTWLQIQIRCFWLIHNPPETFTLCSYDITIYDSKRLLLNKILIIKFPRNSLIVYFWIVFLKYFKCCIFLKKDALFYSVLWISEILITFPSVTTSWLAPQGISPAFGEETLLVMELLQFDGGIIFLLPWPSPSILLPSGTHLSVLHWMIIRLDCTWVHLPLFLCGCSVSLHLCTWGIPSLCM